MFKSIKEAKDGIENMKEAQIYSIKAREFQKRKI